MRLAKSKEHGFVSLDTIYVKCKVTPCTQRISIRSESYIVGGYCASCRDVMVPKHIPLEQQGRFLDILLERKKESVANGKKEEGTNKHSIKKG
jgi:hypothetical protein